MRQEFVQKQRKSLGLATRSLTSEEQDRATDRVVSDALKASKRARRLLRSLREV